MGWWVGGLVGSRFKIGRYGVLFCRENHEKKIFWQKCFQHPRRGSNPRPHD